MAQKIGMELLDQTSKTIFIWPLCTKFPISNSTMYNEYYTHIPIYIYIYCIVDYRWSHSNEWTVRAWNEFLVHVCVFKNFLVRFETKMKYIKKMHKANKNNENKTEKLKPNQVHKTHFSAYCDKLSSFRFRTKQYKLQTLTKNVSLFAVCSASC